MFEEIPKPRKKKVDREALLSPLKRIPGLDLPAVRDLLDLGLSEVDHLRGRAPETLFAEILKARPQTPPDRLWQFRLAVYYAETDSPEPSRLHPAAWQ